MGSASSIDNFPRPKLIRSIADHPMSNEERAKFYQKNQFPSVVDEDFTSEVWINEQELQQAQKKIHEEQAAERKKFFESGGYKEPQWTFRDLIDRQSK